MILVVARHLGLAIFQSWLIAGGAVAAIWTIYANAIPPNFIEASTLRDLSFVIALGIMLAAFALTTLLVVWLWWLRICNNLKSILQD